MRKQPPKPATWDGAPQVRTWDIWTHSYLILGLARSAPASRRRALSGSSAQDRRSVLAHADERRHRHHGPRQSSRHVGDGADGSGARAVLRDGRATLSSISRCASWSRPSAIRGWRCSRRRWPARMPRRSRPARPISSCWNLRRAREAASRDRRRCVSARGRERCGGTFAIITSRSAADRGAASRIARARCSIPPTVFSPYGYVETCSTLAWIQLNRELLAITGEAAYAEEIERSAYNDLLGAQAPDGEDWCYYSFPNGRRVHTTYWRCCKSSGAMALEELPSVAYATSADGVRVNLLGPSEATLQRARCRRGAPGAAHRLSVRRRSRDSRRRRSARRRSRFTCGFRSGPPAPSIRVNGASIDRGSAARAPTSRSSASGARTTRSTLSLPMRPQVHFRTQQQHAGIARAGRLRRCARKCCTSTISPSRAARSCTRPD